MVYYQVSTADYQSNITFPYLGLGSAWQGKTETGHQKMALEETCQCISIKGRRREREHP